MAFNIAHNFKHMKVQDEQQMKKFATAVKNDLTELRTQFVALLTKMDADFADVTNASTDYVSTTSPAALELQA